MTAAGSIGPDAGPKPPLSIAVIGCGSAGPAAALFFARVGHRVQIFERAPRLLNVGAGFLLQPTGMAVLAELGLPDDVLALLYEESRGDHIRFYQRMTRWLTPVFQSSFRPVGWARDLVFPLLNKIGFIRRDMVRTMVGIKRGIVRRSIALAWPPPTNAR